MENKFLYETKKKHADLLSVGCGDGGCRVIKPQGMHTNGGCNCHRLTPEKTQRVIIFFNAVISELENKLNEQANKDTN